MEGQKVQHQLSQTHLKELCCHSTASNYILLKFNYVDTPFMREAEKYRLVCLFTHLSWAHCHSQQNWDSLFFFLLFSHCTARDSLNNKE